MLKINDLSSPNFKKYGYKLDGDFSDIVSYLIASTPMPEKDTLYIRDDEKMHNLDSFGPIKEFVYGMGEIEIGCCNGYNTHLNCLEYHTCPEVDVAASDLCLLLATQDDVKDGKINSCDVEAFLVKKGECVVLNPYVFHFAPCEMGKDGFKCAIILTMGTNSDLKQAPNDKKLWKENKWLYAHKDTSQAKDGAYIGIIGENIEVEY